MWEIVVYCRKNEGINMKKNTYKTDDQCRQNQAFERAKKRKLTVVGQRLFLTIPHFEELDKVYEALELCATKELIEDFAVVLETHSKDPNKAKHLHVFVKFTKRREVSLNFFDFLGKHGCLQSVRNAEAVLQYMNKENECKSNFDVWASLLEKRGTFANTVRRMMLAGWSETELIVKYGSILSSKPWSSAIAFGKKAVAADDAKRDAPIARLRVITREIIETRLSTAELAVFDADPQFSVFVDYVNKILRYGNAQLHKQCCFSIIGRPSIGKSTVVNELKKFFRTYVFPLDGWHTQYDNGIYEIILWNEWDIKLLSRSDLLLFTEGEIVDLRVKYTKAVKKDRPMLLFTSNDSYVEQCHRRYAHDIAQRDKVIDALAVRFVELNFGNTAIWFLTKLFVPTTEDIA